MGLEPVKIKPESPERSGSRSRTGARRAWTASCLPEKPTKPSLGQREGAESRRSRAGAEGAESGERGGAESGQPRGPPYKGGPCEGPQGAEGPMKP